MTLNEYQEQAMSFALPTAKTAPYMLLGLSGEVGELHSLFAKFERDGKIDFEDVKKEIGDVLWFVAGIANHFGYKLQDIADKNIAKLTDRKARLTIQGSGDNR